MRARLFLLLLVFAAAPAFAGQVPVRPQDEEHLSILSFLQAVETAISTMDRVRWTDLLSPNADRDQALEFFEAMVPQGVTRAVIKERDRAPLPGALPGEGYRLVTEVFIETGPRGRIATWRLDIRRPRGEELSRQPWRIVAEDRLASIEGLHRLALHRERQLAARDFVLRSVDFELRMPSGDVFVAETPEGVTAMVLVGDGTMVFHPAPKEERGQLRIFSGGDTLETPFSAAFVRLSPFEFEQRITSAMLEPATLDPRVLRRAQSVFDDEVAKSFSLDLSDLSRETWSLLPQPGDLVAEVRTRRFEPITYARSSGEAEDVTMFQRSRKRNIAAYASEEKLASRGRFYDEDDLVEYDIVDYNVDVAFQPDREWIEGRTRLKLRIKAYALGMLTLRFAETLTVTSVTSDELGRLLFLRVRNQNSVVVNLPTPVARDFVLTLTIAYAGRLPQQAVRDESSGVADGQGRSLDEIPRTPTEPKWVFSNRSYWHPQGQVTDYATATLRIAVPTDYTVVGSGVAAFGSPAMVPATTTGGVARAIFLFSAAQPVRYLGIVISKLARVDSATVALDIAPPTSTSLQEADKDKPKAMGLPPIGSRNTVLLAIEASKRQEPRGRETLGTAAEILRLYAGLMGDVPYDAMTVALVEDDLPGGHAPGYFAVLNNPLPISGLTWRLDPVNFANVPEFFLAHELAHQWFGQAVGWKNYHEQWLSEGFAQYFAALYVRQRRGEPAFRNVLRQFRRWGIEDSDQGPIFLGYRLGHIKGESAVFRALVYNKGAAVLHMLRRLVGDEPFFRGLRRYYADNRFKKAGTDDLRKAMEAETGRDLARFFERWIYDSTLPHLRFTSTVDGQELVVRFEQTAEVFDVPVTVTMSYADGKMAEHIVLVTEAVVEERLPLSGVLRNVEVNQDGAALATIDRK